MMIVKLLPLILLILKTSRCSLIIDNAAQKGLHISDYCPKMKYCAEGAHTMCVYYDPKNVFGPRCFNTLNVTITAELANLMLDVSNTIRSKVAQGIETGKDDVLLPRGYGIFRLKWDSELATFAQVLANQCILNHDLCRATKKFPHPSQTIGLVRFKFPDWEPMSNDKDIKPAKGLTKEKIVFAISKAMRSWYTQKASVTENMLKNFPDFSVAAVQHGRLYLNVIHGPATHMGCGLSGYTEYVYHQTRSAVTQNSLQVVCNYSSGARIGTRTFETEPPIPGQGYSAKCGCPPGSKEDGDCLCNEEPPVQQPTCPLGETHDYCDPALVLLPIFTIEDAPPDKLYQFADEMKDPLKNYILQRLDNTSDTVGVQERFMTEAPARSSKEMFDIFNEKDKESTALRRIHLQSSAQSTATSYNKFKPNTRARTSMELMEFIREKGGENALTFQHENKLSSVEIPVPSSDNFYREHQSSPHFSSVLESKPPPLPPPLPRRSPALQPFLSQPYALPHPPRPPPRIPPPPPPPRVGYSTALQIHDERRTAKSTSQNRRPPPKVPPKHRPMTKKASIFTKVAQFQLPVRRNASPFKVLKKDVEPRKDFSNLNKVVNDYLKRHPGYRIINGNNEQTHRAKDTHPHAEEKSQTEAAVSETGLNKAEETVINFNKYLSQKNNSNNSDKNVDIKDDNDNKLLSLLDNLEKEVNHVALDGDEKQLFDAKIRKIYGSIVGKTAQEKFPKPIIFGNPDPEATEIDFGETRSRDKLEFNQVENEHLKNIVESKLKTRFEVEQTRRPFVQGHKWKNKFIDSFDQKKYNPDSGDKKISDRYDHKYNDDHLENNYGDIQHQRMDELDHKYYENLNKKYNENHLDRDYNEVPKFNENIDHAHHYDIDRKYKLKEPISRTNIKHQADRPVFREFEHNSLNSKEDITLRNYKNTKTNQGPPDLPLITKDRDKRRRNEKIHRKRVESLGSRNDDGILSLERRKYYQEKLDNIKRKLRGRRNGRNNESKNERSLRRMHMKNRESTRLRSNDQADNFYMPERARFLHGF